MLFDDIQLLSLHGKPYIKDITKVNLPAIFRGRPEISMAEVDEDELVELCPTGAIRKNPFQIDLGKCTFCGECALACPEKIKFTNDYKTASNEYNQLIIRAGQTEPITVNPDKVRKEIRKILGRSIRLREVCAGGNNSAEMELNATTNANFDMARFGIDFKASPRHADGIVITGPISENMADPLQICYDAIPEPKIIILVGTDAISGGIFAESHALKRDFLQKYPIDLYVPGDPPHPLTFINGVLDLLRKKK